jgi:hypothetical protein
MPYDSIYGKIYQGGYIFDLNPTTQSGKVCALTDQSNSIEWTLGDYLNTGIGESAQSNFDGAANTNAIITQTTAAAANTYAAGICRLHTAIGDGGLYDWYLPSKDELNLMWLRLADSDGNNQNHGPGDPGNLGGFRNVWYWSSTEWEFAEFMAWGVDFEKSGQTFLYKNTNASVRAVRAF